MSAQPAVDEGAGPEFAPADDVAIPYMQRTRDWYLALGYDNPYRWAHYRDVPFQRLRSGLSAATVALITTAAPYRPDKGPQGPGAPYNAEAKFYAVYSGDTALDHDLRIAHVAIDRKHASMEDSSCWFPLPALREAARNGRIGAVARRFHGAPTNRSQRHTIDVDAPEVLARCREDGVDAAVLVPNCPVCHQTLCLVARHLEQHGIATVVMACAKDIVEHCGVPRALFSDFPLGNAAGRPHDPASQAFTLELALQVLESAPAARTTVQSPLRWSDDPRWKQDFMNVARAAPEELARLRAEQDRAKAIARGIREDAAASGGRQRSAMTQERS
jgi:D-proline reductase (dithiol) PrdB